MPKRCLTLKWKTHSSRMRHSGSHRAQGTNPGSDGMAARKSTIRKMYTKASSKLPLMAKVNSYDIDQKSWIIPTHSINDMRLLNKAVRPPQVTSLYPPWIVPLPTTSSCLTNKSAAGEHRLIVRLQDSQSKLLLLQRTAT